MLTRKQNETVALAVEYLQSLPPDVAAEAAFEALRLHADMDPKVMHRASNWFGREADAMERISRK